MKSDRKLYLRERGGLQLSTIWHKRLQIYRYIKNTFLRRLLFNFHFLSKTILYLLCRYSIFCSFSSVVHKFCLLHYTNIFHWKKILPKIKKYDEKVANKDVFWMARASKIMTIIAATTTFKNNNEKNAKHKKKMQNNSNGSKNKNEKNEIKKEFNRIKWVYTVRVRKLKHVYNKWKLYIKYTRMDKEESTIALKRKKSYCIKWTAPKR